MADWPTRSGNSRRTGFAAESLRTPLSLRWKSKVGGSIWGGPTVSDSLVLIPGDKLSAVDLRSGRIIWQTEEVKSSGYTSAEIREGTAYICGLEHLFRVDLDSGRVVGMIPFGSVNSSPCLHQNRVYWAAVGKGYRRLMAASYDLKMVLWSIDTGEVMHFTPTCVEDRIYMAGMKSLFCVRAENGEFVWRSDHPGAPGKPLDTAALTSDHLLVSIKKAGLYSINPSNGAVRWQYATRHGPVTAPCVHEPEGVAYVASRRLHAVSIVDGKEIWSSEELGLFTSNPVVVGEHIFIGGGHRRRIYGIDRGTGEMVWEYHVGDFVFSSPAYADQHLVIGCHDGFVYCFGQD